ncbi:MAG: chemotaxis protein CheW [Polyangiaceae bacterium]|nr:chemotaxis protein CheW [Polyangiaceae bacterium]
MTGTDELSEFLEPEAGPGVSEQQQRQTVVCDLLLFEYGGHSFAVLAECVDSVVPWKAPAVVPGADARVRGVIQDRGRIVVVMAHPTGQQGPGGEADASRIIICTTPRGHIGLPASVTHNVGPVELTVEPTAYSVHDSPRGPFTFVDPMPYCDRAS